jgi:hypothetical protein
LLFSADYDKIFVALGARTQDYQLTSEVELIDLASEASKCPTQPDFPESIIAGVDFMN